MIRHVLILLAALAGLPSAVAAQTWQGLTMDAPLPDALPQAATRPKDSTGRFAAFCDHRWTDLPDGLFLRVANTRGCDGPVATIYASTSLSNPVPVPLGYGDVILGETTLRQVVAQLGSDGLIGLGYGDTTAGALNYVLIYEVADSPARVILNFLTTDPAGASVALRPRDQAWLYAVEMLSPDFASLRHVDVAFTPSPNYRAIEDLFQ